jgi:hypothetical protein
MQGRAAEGRGCGGWLLCHPSSSYASSGLFAAAAEPDTNSVTSYRAVVQLADLPQLPAIQPVGTPDHSTPAPVQHHIHAADFPWTALFAATGGPSDIYAYFASPRSGSEHHHLDADYLWTYFIAAIGGP